MTYEPGIYVKDGRAPRRASSVSDAVALEFDGYVRQAEEATEATEAEVDESSDSTSTEVLPAAVSPSPSAPRPEAPAKPSTEGRTKS